MSASAYTPSFYDKYVKRGLDIVLSFGGIVALSPLLLGIAAAIKIDDPGPVFSRRKDWDRIRNISVYISSAA